MNNIQMNQTARIGGITLIAGATVMFIGAGFYFSTGIDLWGALATNTIADYLVATAAVQTQLITNLTLWIIGILLLGMGGAQLVTLGKERPALARMARVCLTTGVPLAILSFIAMLSVVVQLGGDGSETAVVLAKTVGWIGTRTDDLATALIVGIAPLFIALAAKKAWMPNWLFYWAIAAFIIGVISLVGIYLPALADIGFLIVPVGLGWMIATGVTLLRLSPA
ncbi:hypothetical protein [Candidatus Leptofilum sp.]|uniref:hypothetical protein n=1 Tax=Candidatus Leptofilum sp. TaxID=3241576 RepID=UPI003B58BFBB